jgi:hypothetical protein
MALQDLTTTSGASVTSLPDWYNTAQQNLVNSAISNAAAAPQLNQTVAQGAVNTLSGPNNPFTNATSTLQSIASGAANPWLVDQTTGAVTPNTNTALGGLFAAQNQQLNRALPTTLAPTEALGIGSGNFGSLRGQTAVDTAKAKAFTDLFAQQNQAALNNQQTGVSAAANAGNVTQQGITNAMNVGQTQMTAPFTSTANLGNILASINVPSTVKTTQTASPLQSITGLGSVIQGGLNALYGTSGTNPVLAKLGTSIANGLSGLNFGSSNSVPSSSQINSVSNPTNLTPDNLPTGSTPVYDSSGSYIGYNDTSGNFVEMDQ